MYATLQIMHVLIESIIGYYLLIIFCSSRLVQLFMLRWSDKLNGAS